MLHKLSGLLVLLLDLAFIWALHPESVRTLKRQPYDPDSNSETCECFCESAVHSRFRSGWKIWKECQITEGMLITSQDVVKSGTAKLNAVSHVSGVNKTSHVFTENLQDNATYEDQKNFQNQEDKHHYSQCDETLLVYFIDTYCMGNFELSMIALGEDSWCNWEMVLGHYNTLTHCMESCAGVIKCYYPNAVVQEMFMEVHTLYFNSCATKEEALPDAPASVVLMLTLLPVSVIPVLVYMVIRKSSVID